jgi:DtxR family transcriptional regulator, Mn-dependent transcriptional regulator
VSPASPQRGPRRAFVDSKGTYLRIILELEEEFGLPPRTASLHARLGISRSAMRDQLRDLHDTGLVEFGFDDRVELTGTGRGAAARVMRKHRLAERLLVDVIGLDWDLAHAEASRWQHVLSDEVERRLLGLLDAPWTSPYGNPVPALEELDTGIGGPAGPRPATTPCDGFARAGGGAAVVHLVGEGVQADAALLHRLFVAGARPGATVRVRRTGTWSVGIDAGAGVVDLDMSTARSIVVLPNAGPARP